MASLTELIHKRNRKEKQRPQTISEEQKVENLKHWTTFYRRNINMYVKDRLGVRLEPYQHLMIWLMSKSLVFVGICSRGLGKSFLTALFAVAKCMLYPHYQVVVVSSTIPQSMVIYNKVKQELCGGSTKNGISPFLSYLYQQKQIDFKQSDTALEINFLFNGSRLMCVPCSDASRGLRSNCTIYDEFRLLKKGLVDSVFEPMAFRRQSDFLNTDEYADKTEYMEDAVSCFISSSGWKTDWLWNLSRTTVTDMINGRGATPSNLFACDVYLPMRYNRITMAQYKKLKSQMSDLTFRIEMLNECVGESADSYFKLEEFKANQIITKAFRTPTTSEYLMRKDMGNPKKLEEEKRICFVDFAFEKSLRAEGNDNTVVGVLSCKWRNGELSRNLMYLETLEGGGDPVARIKEIYYDLDVDYIVYDSKNGGDVYARDFTKSYMHPERGVEFKGFTAASETELHVANINKVNALADSAIDPTAIQCLIPVTATADLNSAMWMDLKVNLQNGKLRMLISDLEFESSVANTKNWLKMDAEEHTRIRLPYVQSELLISEAINLTPKFSEGKVKLTEARNAWKDRVVALSYGNYIASLLENKLAKEMNDIDYDISNWSLVF